MIPIFGTNCPGTNVWGQNLFETQWKAVLFATFTSKIDSHSFQAIFYILFFVKFDVDIETIYGIFADKLNTSKEKIKQQEDILLKFSLIRCQCNGHATHCAPTDETDDQDGPRDEITTMQCMCMHGTAGKNCETCLTDHWNRPWRRATSQQANECKRKFSPIRIFTWFTTWVLCRYRVSYGRVFLSRYLFATALL